MLVKMDLPVADIELRTLELLYFPLASNETHLDYNYQITALGIQHTTFNNKISSTDLYNKCRLNDFGTILNKISLFHIQILYA